MNNSEKLLTANMRFYIQVKDKNFNFWIYIYNEKERDTFSIIPTNI